MTVELDRRPGDDMPRVTVKRFQPLDSLAKRTRLQLRSAHRRSVAGRRNCARAGSCAGRQRHGPRYLPISDGRQATLLLGRDFTLDADLAARLTRILGEGAVELSAQEPPRLALVG